MTRLFAEIESDTVIGIVVVNDEDCLDANGEFSEQVGANYLRQVYRDGVFLETRYDGTLRRFAAAIGGTYLPELDEFRPPQPADTWVWDDDLGEWIDPDAEPELEET